MSELFYTGETYEQRTERLRIKDGETREQWAARIDEEMAIVRAGETREQWVVRMKHETV